jgi:putative ABC transport system permease protein
MTTAWWSESIDSLAAYRNPRFQTMVLVCFAAFALVLTGLGVFGVVSVLVAMRTKEMSIRMAMGATHQSLVSFVLKQAFTPIVVGIMMGLLATHWARRLAEAQLFQVDTRDPAMLVAAALTVILATLAAAYLPARRAGRLDPAQVLRAE